MMSHRLFSVSATVEMNTDLDPVGTAVPGEIPGETELQVARLVSSFTGFYWIFIFENVGYFAETSIVTRVFTVGFTIEGFAHWKCDQVIGEVIICANKMRLTVRSSLLAKCLSVKFGFRRRFATTCHKRSIDDRCLFFGN